MSNHQILIIADDLSGAADCTGGALRAGLTAQVTLGGAQMQPASSTAQVWSIDADTRRLSAQDAAQACVHVLNQCGAENQLVYKKIDSTLRGHIAQEVAALLPALGLAIVAPAFPEAGRVTRHGCQYLGDTALENTEIWHQGGIFRKADIQEMLLRSGIRNSLVRLESVRTDPANLHQQFEYYASRGAQAIVCDAETEADLAHIAQASMRLRQPVFWVGSAGLAGQLPAAAGLSGSHVPKDLPVRGAIMVVVGSAASASQVQARALARNRGIVRLNLTQDVLLQEPGDTQWLVLQQKISDALTSGQDVLFVLVESESGARPPEGILANRLGKLVVPFLPEIGGMISTGGETTREVLSAYGCTGLQMMYEVERGIPMSYVEGVKRIPLITKAGAFGTTHTLIHCYDTLHRARMLDA